MFYLYNNIIIRHFNVDKVLTHISFQLCGFSFPLENVFPLLTGQDLSSQGDVMLTLCKETVIIVALN